MAKKIPVCKSCGKPLLGGACSNSECETFVDVDVSFGPSVVVYGDSETPASGSVGGFRSLVPEDLGSLDPNQIVDHTGTIGIAPRDLEFLKMGSAPAEGENNGSEGFAPTRIVDDEFYQQIQSMFPGESDSHSSPPLDTDRDPTPAAAELEGTQSLSIRGVRSTFMSEGFVPPMRDIRFPTDTASLEKLKISDPASLKSDEYSLISKLGEGGYGIVYEVEQTALGRSVAVKVLKLRQRRTGSKTPSGSGSKSGTGSGETQRRQNQFLHEAKITARLQHPNIVPLYDFGINPEGELFYSMKKVEKRPWSSVIYSPAKLLGISENAVDEAAQRDAVNQNVEIFDKVCDAMAYSHSQKIIHRDLKPDNIMIGSYGEVLLLDFGMALDFSQETPEFSAGGTLVYMAPEMAKHFAKQREIQMLAYETAMQLGLDKGSLFLDQSNLLGIGKLALRLLSDSKDPAVIEKAELLVKLDAEEKLLAKAINHSADIYLLGAILYQVAVGHPPHYFPLSACKAKSTNEKKAKAEKFQKELWLACDNGIQQYSKLTDPLKISLAEIAKKAMATDPQDRFQTVEQLQAAIGGYQLQVQSLQMTETGKEEFAKSKGREDYRHLLPALESFRGATELWPESEQSKSLQVATACEYAQRAHLRKDFDPGLDILDEYVDPSFQKDQRVLAAREKLHLGKRKRSRNRMLAMFSSVAAVVLPLALFTYFSYATASIRTQAKEAREGLKTAQVELKSAQETQEIAVASQEKAVAAASKAEVARKTAETLQASAETAVKQANVQLAEANTAIQQANVSKREAEALVEQTKVTLLDTETKLKDAEVLQREAKLKADQALVEAAKAEKLAAKFRFDSEFGDYSSNVLPIPLDIRKGNITQAAQRLQQLLSSNAKEYFKNGWLVQHYRKKLNVDFSGTKKALQPLGQNTQIISVIPSVEANDSLVLGTESGQPQMWRMTVGEDPQKLDWALPDYGTLAGATRSHDGKWLALTIDNVKTGDVFQNQLWIINTQNGQQLPLDEPNKFVVGCTNAKFVPGSNRLVTIEELDGYVGLKKRVQLVTRQIDADSVKVVGEPFLVGATTRGLGEVNYLSDILASENQLTVALVYQALATNGTDIYQLEVLRAAGDAEFASVNKNENLEAIPTALHLAPNDQLICGFADGRLDQFSIENTTIPRWSINQNESRIVQIDTTDKGQLISGSENGILILWDVSSDDAKFVKRLAGQPGELTSLAIGSTDPVNGFTMVTGDRKGFVRFWQPETSQQDADIRKEQPSDVADGSAITKGSLLNVTCAAIDQAAKIEGVPATVYGTDNGEVYYFDADKMRQRGSVDPLMDLKHSGPNARFKFKVPFESFDLSFDDFDSIGIVGDQFVLLKNDGTFFHSLIDADNSLPSSNSRAYDLPGEQPIDDQFVPLLASVDGKNYFFSTNPEDAEQLIWWRWSGAKFAPRPIELASQGRGVIKRLTLSPNGQWLAVIRKAGGGNSTGEYRTEIYEVQNEHSANGNPLTLSTPTRAYRVGDPAFAGFSADSQQMILHFHKLGVDRETWLETWNLTGGGWQEAGTKRRLDSRKVALVDWNGQSAGEGLVTKINKRFYVSNLQANDEYDSLEFETKDSNTTRTVRASGKGDSYYVLDTSRLQIYKDAEPAEVLKDDFHNARNMRVFGDRAIILDDDGFHLINSKTGATSILAARKTAVDSLSLANGRMAVVYSGSGLCRVWDVRGEQPEGLGEIDKVRSIKLSPDGQWAAALRGEELLVFKTDSKFNTESFKRPVAKDCAFQWTGGNQPHLLMAESNENVVWTKIDPINNQNVNIDLSLPMAINGLIDFELASLTQKYLAITSSDGISLWAVDGDEAIQLSQADGFDSSQLKNVKSMTFSEIEPASKKVPEDVGTRLVVLADDRVEVETNQSSAELSIYLLASEETASEQDPLVPTAVAETTTRYRVVEIDGALDKTEGRELTDAEFSGDGRTLLQVDTRGITALLSQ